MKIIECIPNFSDARRPEVIEAIINAVAQVPGVHVLDRHSDMDHNRTVLTFIGDPAGVEEAAYQGIAKAAELIDLNQHEGEHPRLGAADVVPFVPITDVTMQECVEIARRLSKRVAETLGIPVYLYEEAAVRTDRKNLEDIRRGEYEGIKETIATDPYREPDFGPKEMGPAGAVVIGAREPLIAYNIYLNTPDVSIAEKIARRVRNSSGGFHYVKGMGVLVDGLAQVSMNLTNYRRSPMAQVTEFVRREAQRYGVGIHHSEIVGLLPSRAIINAGRYYLQLDGFDHDQLLENRLFSEQQAQGATSQTSFLDQVAEGTTAPGGGSAAAYAGALGAALAVMVARLTTGKAKYKDVEEECWQVIEKGEELRQKLTEAIELDAKSFEGILIARRLPKDTDENINIREKSIMEASFTAAAVPLHTAQMCMQAMKLALRMAQIGNLSAISDAASGVFQAQAGLEAAFLNVEINLLGYENENVAVGLLQQARELKQESEGILAEVKQLLKDRAEL
ncbi:MAG: glutamate formimidoyltransferase [Anaerolineaceae bacterium]|jgi:glutamate formiminotransferase/formiminotetrahydrofolate cyclodeaminase|nr:glutamate formimidoyltransferase [Anaerolineaceae bacterium]MDD4043683.1 glutamate formimidoyltransferase [Anaerolineaceae bacterium]MDD4578056.1 glutamate formimidoyltransferase [Anaerolineaceae bacterium]